MSTPLLPNTELVAKHWLLAAVEGVDANVATTLPDLPWANDEFIRIASVGGTPEIDNPLFSGVISVECYAARPGSTKPPWGHASNLAMRVVMACYGQRGLYNPDPRVLVSLPAGYGPAQVESVWPVSEVRKAPPDPSQYALYLVDLALTWIPAGVTVG